jgi:flagellar hook-associated protein 1 FlgK
MSWATPPGVSNGRCKLSMITLTAALNVAGGALEADSQAIAITGENLTNQSTPGYSRQIALSQSDGFSPTQGLSGGVSFDFTDSRSQFAEQAVWYQQSQAGQYQSFTTNASAVSQVLGLNNVGGSTGVQNSLNQLLSSFTTLAASPNSSAAQNGVIENAQAFATDLGGAAQTIQQTVTSAQSQASTVVSQINQLVGQIQQYNSAITSGVPPGATAEAQVYASLETLSNLAPITARQSNDGAISITIGGSTPLLEGTTQYNLQSNLVAPASGATYPQGNPTVQILNSQGQDITSSVTSGQLGGIINYVNTFAPTLLGNGNQQGSLNQLAQSVADSVNGVIGGSTPLFQYGAGSPTAVAQSLQVNSSFTPSDLTPADAANLPAIAAGTTSASQINGQSFSDFLDSTASTAASTLNSQQSSLSLHTQLLGQAQANRTQVQGVSLETESVNLLQYQQAFQASSQLISVINTLLQETMNMANVTPA